MQDSELKNEIIKDLKKELLKNEIIKDLKKEFSIKPKNKTTHIIFSNVRNKNLNKNGFSKLVGPFNGHKAWGCIRILTCISVGETYVQNIKESDFELVNKVAEQLYEVLTKAYLEHLSNKETIDFLKETFLSHI